MQADSKNEMHFLLQSISSLHHRGIVIMGSVCQKSIFVIIGKLESQNSWLIMFRIVSS